MTVTAASFTQNPPTFAADPSPATTFTITTAGTITHDATENATVVLYNTNGPVPNQSKPQIMGAAGVWSFSETLVAPGPGTYRVWIFNASGAYFQAFSDQIVITGGGGTGGTAGGGPAATALPDHAIAAVGVYEIGTAATTAPDVPTDLTFTSVTSTTTTVTVTAATTGSAATGYRLEQRVGSNAWSEVGSQVSAVFALTGLTASTAYEYRARAFNSAGNGGYGVSVTQATANPAGPPTITSASTVAVFEGQTSVGTLAASVQNDASVSWSIVGGADQARFVLSASGVLAFQTIPDFENPADSDANNVYVVQIAATANDLQVSQTLTVVVLDVQDNLQILQSAPLNGVAGQTETIEIVILSNSGLPVAGALVAFVTTSDVVISTGTTNASGKVVLTVTYGTTQGAGSGRWSVSVLQQTTLFPSVPVYIQPLIDASVLASSALADTSPKYSDELFPYVFDFSPMLRAGETIVSVLSVTCRSSPVAFDQGSSQMLIGKPVILGKYVVHFLDKGKLGGKYVIRVTAQCSHSTAIAEQIVRVYATAGRR